jgi:hypothetical protein
MVFCVPPAHQPNPVLSVLVGIPYLVIVVAMGTPAGRSARTSALLALAYYFRGEIGRMSVCLVLAVTFHKSAIIVIPLIGLAASRRLQTFALLIATSAIMYWLFVSSFRRVCHELFRCTLRSSGAGIRVAMNVAPATIFLIFRNRFSESQDELRLCTIFSIRSFVTLLLLCSVAVVDCS